MSEKAPKTCVRPEPGFVSRPVRQALLAGAAIIAGAVILAHTTTAMPQAAASQNQAVEHTRSKVEMRSRPAAWTQPGVTKAATTIPAKAQNPAQKLIYEQFEAIRQRDTTKALLHTTSAFNAKYEESGDFLQWARFRLRALYNFEDYKFLGSYELEDSIVQKVEVRDRYHHKPVTLIYKVKKLEDGSWSIDALAVINDETRPI